MKPLCPVPFTHMFWRGNRSGLTNEGTWRTCCESKTNQYEVKFGPDATFEEVWNNPMAQEIRESLANGEWHPNCIACVQQQKIGNDIPAKFWRDFERKDMELGVFSSLDYRPSNLCNLKCRMCTPMHSSLIATDERPEFAFDKRSQKDRFVDKIDFNDLKKIKLLGGEPSIMEEAVDVINSVKTGTEIMVTSNMFKISKAFEKAIDECQGKVRINISLDAIGKTYDYIRVNSDWKRVEDNILRFQSKPNVELAINPVAMMWNAFNIPDLIEWAETNDIEIGSFHHVGQQWLRLSLLYPEHRIELAGLNAFLDQQLKEVCLDRDVQILKFRQETLKYDDKYGTNIMKIDERFGEYL